MRISKTTVVLILLLLFTLSAGYYSLYARPQLILTPEKISELQKNQDTRRQELYDLAIRCANDFVSEAIPVMKNAHNRYRRIGDTMPALGLAYLMTKDKKYVAAASAWLNALLAVPEWNGSQNLGRSSWIVGCALLYDWLYEELGNDLRKKIGNRLNKECHLILEENSSHRLLSNHMLIETSALGITGMSLKDEIEDAGLFLNTADEWTTRIIKHAPLDGSWGEGVQYWQYGTGYFLRYLEAAKTFGFKDYYPVYEWLKINGYFPIYFSLPERPTQFVNFSDCNSKAYMPSFLFFLPAAVYQNEYFQDFGIKALQGEPHKFSWLDFIFYDPNLQAKDCYTLPEFKHFTDNGFVTMRSGWDKDATVVGFRCGPAPGHQNQQDPMLIEKKGFGPGHGHPDINSFCIYSTGQWLALDPGYTHLKDTRNHNTIIVNGYGQAGAGGAWLDYLAFEKRDPAPSILYVQNTPEYDYVLGDAGNIYVDEARLTGFRRHLLFLKPNVVVIADDIEAGQGSTIEWLLNFNGSINEINKDKYKINHKGVGLFLQQLLPANSKIDIQEREVDASDAEDGRMKTFNQKVENTEKLRFLTVLCVLPDSNSENLVVSLNKQVLDIKHMGRTWKVKVVPQQNIRKKSDPVLIVQTAGKPDVKPHSKL
ncbi:heparinase II/III family protein [candidate division KSB1 bacterium]|nr:heparinase II/III family protein [candidate division KSB1 bacterium]